MYNSGIGNVGSIGWIGATCKNRGGEGVALGGEGFLGKVGRATFDRDTMRRIVTHEDPGKNTICFIPLTHSVTQLKKRCVQDAWFEGVFVAE